MAVYTDVADHELSKFLTQYDIGPLVSFKGIAEGVENSNFLIRTDGLTYILTIYEKRVNRGDLPFFLELMEHLAARNIPCPTPVHATDGPVLRTLAEKPAALVSFLDGVCVSRPNESHCVQLGCAIGRMHLAGRNFTMRRENALALNGWKQLIDACGPRANDVGTGWTDALWEEYLYLHKAWPQNLPGGVIHADLFPDNVFFVDNQLSGIIDFYFACNDFLAYDVAICLNAWCFDEEGNFNISNGEALLDGYQQIRRFTDAEVAALPILARGSALRFLLTRLYDWLNQVDGALVRPKEPKEFWEKLRFHQTIKSSTDYGIR